MSPKQPSKQKRAAQNRNQRAAREARAANANAAPGEGVQTSSANSGSLLSRLRGGSTGGGSASRAATPGTARSRGAALRATQPPGYRAALSALLAAGAALLLCTFALRYPVDAQGDLYTSETLTADWSVTALQAAVDQPEATGSAIADSITDWAPGRDKDTVIKALWPFSLAIFLPLIGAALGFQAVRKRSSSKVINRALYATLFGAVLTQGLLLLFLPVVLGMGVAMFQVRKAETIAAASGSPGGVIDVEEVVAEDEIGQADEADADDVTEVEGR